MKTYMNIEAVRLAETPLSKSNTDAFKAGDLIQITEKYDGSNASVRWENGELCCFSRKMKLNINRCLNGFWDYAQNMTDIQKTFFKEHDNLIIFGEWNNRNKIKSYNDEPKTCWYVYDIYDVHSNKWWPQGKVKQVCKTIGLTYIHVLYEGPFVSWDHCKAFLNENTYGETQEGIVIKNQTIVSALYIDEIEYIHSPFYVKIVNESFSERMEKKIKEIDPETLAEMELAQKAVESIVVRARVEKMIYKLINEGELPEKLEPRHMKILAKKLPQLIYQDCVKEEPKLVEASREYFGKICNKQTMKIAREIVVG